MKLSKRLKASLLAGLLCLLFGETASCPNKFENDLPEASMPFGTIREFNKVYVDKTSYMQFFLPKFSYLCYVTRPRRFGKSTFVDALESFFRGHKNGEEFKRTKIYQYGNTAARNGTWVKQPVIKIDMSDFNSFEPFWNQLHKQLKIIAANYEVVYDENSCLRSLIKDLYKKFRLRVIILIDEYDVLLNDWIYSDERNNTSNSLKETERNLNEFLRQIKSNALYIKFAMLVGVNKYSLSSGPNCFDDITYHPAFSQAFGFTKSEILDNFHPHISNFSAQREKSFDQIVKELEDRYDGYVFSKEDTTVKIFNPISVIQSMANHDFKAYWSSTGSIKFLVKQLFKSGRSLEQETKNVQLKKGDLDKTYDLDINHVDINRVMLHTGYLTITKIDGDSLELGIPNNEIKEYLEDHYYSYLPSENCFLDDLKHLTRALKASMANFEVSEIIKNLNRICFPDHFENVLNQSPYEYEINKRMTTAFKMAGIKFDNPQINVPVQKGPKGVETVGDLDLVTSNLKINYVFELKRGSLEKAIAQIMRYFKCDYEVLKKYTGHKQRLYLLAVSYTRSKNSTIEDWVAIPCNGNEMEIDDIIPSSDEVNLITNRCFNENKNFQCKNPAKIKLPTSNYYRYEN